MVEKDEREDRIVEITIELSEDGERWAWHSKQLAYTD